MGGSQRDKRKKILFMGPAFMGYELEIIDNLSTQYFVDYLDTEKVLRIARDRYKSINTNLKALFKFVIPLRERYRETLLAQAELDSHAYSINGQYDVIFVINGDGVTDEFYEYLRRTSPQSTWLLYLWDDRKTLFKVHHIERFQKVFSYNIDDCARFGYSFQPMFTQQRGIDALFGDVGKEHDICIIGSATKERVRATKQLIKKYGNRYSIYIYLYSRQKCEDIDTYNTPLSFEEYMRTLEKSRCVLEIVRKHQTGPTTRVNDCIFTKTKVITNNQSVKRYPQYNKNIMVVRNCKITISDEFVEAPYYDCDKGITVNEWIGNVVTDENTMLTGWK